MKADPNQWNKDHKTLSKLSKSEIHLARFVEWLSILDDKFGLKCSNCGYDKCFSALDFHHFDRNKKEKNLGQLLNYCNPSKWQKELDKGTLLCASCHRELHCSCQGRDPSILSEITWIITPLRNWWPCISRRVRRYEMRIEKLRDSLLNTTD